MQLVPLFYPLKYFHYLLYLFCPHKPLNWRCYRRLAEYLKVSFKYIWVLILWLQTKNGVSSLSIRVYILVLMLLFKFRFDSVFIFHCLSFFLSFKIMIIYDNRYKAKENKSWVKIKFEAQHVQFVFLWVGLIEIDLKLI